MLAYILAIAIALASLSLYLSAFFLPELHRKDDFLWSGVGLFYALILWVCAGRMTGGVLLGQAAAVTLMLSFGWQTVRLRRAIAHPDEQTDLSGFSLLTWVQNRLGKKTQPQPITPPVVETPTPVIEETEEPEIPQGEVISQPQETPEIETSEVVEEMTLEEVLEVAEAREASVTIEETETPETEPLSEPLMTETETEAELSSDVPPQPVIKKQGFSLKSWFGFGKSKSQPVSKPLPEQEKETEAENWEDEDEDESLEIEETIPMVVETTEEMTREEKNWDDDDDDDLSEVVEETEVITAETIVEIPEETTISSEVVLEKTTNQPETLEQYVADFEPFLADDEAETLIESYQPKLEKVATETVKIEPETPPFPVTSAETAEQSEKVEETPEKSEDTK
ncbi:Ycf66 family protein [Crocosphaera sp. UHCC 0190]|uniref:Ycf66 family protein n=1 Tax=Crocosphaera sp. UHCC 0190 TaxID=3110246 RepID=UPI002B221512|nr:Ycf66 family protein [Crocosphaera sp. UHCC 0190]MEA5508879.1 Ycf66 family protein [Crocosphaera sp. UHCC 0190]